MTFVAGDCLTPDSLVEGLRVKADSSLVDGVMELNTALSRTGVVC